MQGYNVIMVYNPEGDRLLMCKRANDPYMGLYNLVGGKIEPDEDGLTAAYRELHEETGIAREIITLHHLMDFTYHYSDCYVEAYVGRLITETVLVEEKHALCWMDTEQDFFNMTRFAGEGNIGHILEQAKFSAGLIWGQIK